MGTYTRYKLYQKYEKRGDQERIPVYPNTYSINGDGTMPLVIVKDNDPQCGYTGDTQPIYRWYQMPIDSYYICDDCPTPSKLILTYEGGQTYSLECNSSSTISTNDTTPSGYTYSTITSAVIGDCVTQINSYAFTGCRLLTNVVIGSGVTYIGHSVFQQCTNLTSFTIYASTPPRIGEEVFRYVSNFTIYVPSESVALYKSTSGWDEYASRIQAIP